MILNDEYVRALDDACFVAAGPAIIQEIYCDPGVLLVAVTCGRISVIYFDYEDEPSLYTALMEYCVKRCQEGTLESARSRTAWSIAFLPAKLV